MQRWIQTKSLYLCNLLKIETFLFDILLMNLSVYDEFSSYQTTACWTINNDGAGLLLKSAIDFVLTNSFFFCINSSSQSKILFSCFLYLFSIQKYYKCNVKILLVINSNRIVLVNRIGKFYLALHFVILIKCK